MRRLDGKRALRGAFLSLAAAATVGFLCPSRLGADGTVPGLLAQLNGDVNADAGRDLSDAVYLLNYIFRGGPAPRALACEPAAVDGSVVVAHRWGAHRRARGGRAVCQRDRSTRAGLYSE